MAAGIPDERTSPSGDEEAVLEERDAANLRRLRVLLPLVALLTGVGAWLGYRGQQQAPEAALQRWQAGVALLDGVMALFVVVMMGLLRLSASGARSSLRRWVPTAMAMVFILWGALLGANAQLARPNIDAYVYASFGVTALFLVPPAAVAAAQVVASGVLVASMMLLQPQPEVRRAQIMNVAAVALIATVLSRVLYRNFLRQESDRLTITRQKLALEGKQAELEALNHELAERVEQKVRVALEQAREVEQLTTRLQERVRERSRELLAALKQASSDRVDGGVMAPGTVLGERVRLSRVLGAGGMGVVYEGVELSTGHTVAVKVVHASAAGGVDALHRFLREALAAASVAHPAVVRTLQVDVAEGGVLFQVQELVRGVSLRQVMEARGVMPAGHVARVGSILAGALAAAHAAGVVHRDIKPGNVMLTMDGVGLRLIDFGISRLRDEVDRSVTRTGQIVGTPEYLSPEQIVEPSKVGPATDIYALGAMLYRLLAGGSPFGPRSAMELIAAHTSQPPRSLSESAPQTPHEVEALVMACLGKLPTERPDAQELERSLGRVADALQAPTMRDIARQWITETQAPDATRTSMPMSG